MNENPEREGMLIARYSAVAFAAVLFMAPTARAQQAPEGGDLAGAVRDAGGYPVPSAEVLIAGGRWRGKTDAQGNFLIVGVPAGQWNIRARHFGYVPVDAPLSIVSGRAHTVTLQLEHLPATVLRTITVYERSTRERFRGVMVGARTSSRWNADALDESGYFSVRDFLRSREGAAASAQEQRRWVSNAAPGSSGRGDPCALSPFGTNCGDAAFFYQNDQVGRRGDVVNVSSTAAKPCAGYDVYVNGQRSPEWILDELDPHDLDGVDMARYGSGGGMLGTCATVAVWMKAPPADIR